MIINKSYMEIMRRGKSNLNYYSVRKQNHSGIILGVCILIALILMISCAHAGCTGLSPKLQKAYDQLKSEGFDVSCRRGL